MVDEFLRISQGSVSVRYEFRNESSSEIKTIIAFPMPRFWWNPGEAQVEANVGPLGGFKTLVAGQAVETNVDTKAWLGRRDITPALKAAGISEANMVGAMSCRSEDAQNRTCISADVSRRLNKTIASAIVDDVGAPAFEVQQTAWWEQKFPAQSSLRVDHTYAPKVGYVGNGYSGFESDLKALTPWAPGRKKEGVETHDTACLAEGTEAALLRRIQRLAKLNEGRVWVTLNDVEYVLGTGRNWKGPIGNFVLQVVKQSPDQLVSLCFPGSARKVDDLTLEFSAKNFRPPDSLVVYFYTVKTEGQIAREIEEERARQLASRSKK
jgi:hypothetical protein